MAREIISTDKAPAAIGTYSQAVRAGDTVYLSGQIALSPTTMEIVDGGIEAQTVCVFENLLAVVEAAGGAPGNIVKLTIYLADLGHFAIINEIMGGFFQQPYPARAAVEVAALPRGALIEIDAIMYLG